MTGLDLDAIRRWNTGTALARHDYHDRAPVRYCGSEERCPGVINSDNPDDWCCHIRFRRKRRQRREEAG